MSRLWQAVRDILLEFVILSDFFLSHFDFGTDIGAFHQINPPVQLQTREDIGQCVSDIFDSSGDHSANGIGEIGIDVAANDVQIFETHLFSDMLQKLNPSLDALGENDPLVGEQNFQGNSGKSRSRPDIDQREDQLRQLRHDQAVNIVPDRNVSDFEKAGEIFFFLVFHEQFVEVSELPPLFMSDSGETVISENVGQSVIGFLDRIDRLWFAVASFQLGVRAGAGDRSARLSVSRGLPRL